MENKYKLGLYSLIVFGVIVLSVSMMNNTSVPYMNEELLGDLDFNDPTPQSTNVQWHGTLDLFVKEAGSDTWEQVVYGEENLITNLGASRIRGLLNGSITTGETIANLSLSNDMTDPTTSTTKLIDEITTNGLDRQQGTMANNGTMGAFNITHTWTATASQSAQQIGTHWSVTDDSDNNLFSALEFTQQDLLVNDQLKAVYSVTIS